jgi:hypothetical protein
MTIILQHQFWDLNVTERAFEVGLSFGGISERLVVPFDSIIAFYDPAVQFGFQFEAIEAAAAGERGEDAVPADDKTAPKPLPAGKSAAPQKDDAPAGKEPPVEDDDRPDGGGEVVRLDRFRKK